MGQLGRPVLRAELLSCGFDRRVPVWALGALLLCAIPAHAQEQAIGQAPGFRGTLPDGLTLPGRAALPSRITTGLPTDDRLAATELRPAIPDGDPTADPVDPLLDDIARPAPGERIPVVDGDLTLPEEPDPIARDGIVEIGEPPAPQDGVDPTLIDSRPQEDADLFTTPIDNPPAGYDPLLFQIEDIDPLRTDRRPRRLFVQEPYDPIGIRIGSFVYFPEVIIAGEATSNVLRQTPASSDVSAEFLSRARIVSNWAVHALEFNATGLTSFHDEFPSEDDAAWNLEARGRLDVSRLTNFQGLIAHDVRQEGRGAIDAVEFGDRAQVTTDSVDLTFNHRFNRLSVQLRGGYDDIDFGPGDNNNDTTNDDRDTTVTTQAIRTTWQFRPTFAVFGEVEANQREYNVAAVSDGFSRDSDGERYRAGIDFGSTGQIVRGEMSIGYGTQNPSDAGLSDVDGVLIDANVAWRLSEPTTIRFIATTEIFDTNTAGSAGVLSHTIGLEARHAFRRYVIATAGIAYTDQDYDDVPITETELRASLLLEYYLNRDWTLFGQWETIDFDSNQAGNSWTANDVRVGARWRQ
jgi:hypothetical protein